MSYNKDLLLNLIRRNACTALASSRQAERGFCKNVIPSCVVGGRKYVSGRSHPRRPIGGEVESIIEVN